MADSPLGTYVDSAGVVRAITGIAQASPGDVLGSYIDASGVPRPISGVALLGGVEDFQTAADKWASARGWSRLPVAIGIVGQSNERGQVDPAETISGVASRTAYPQAYRSLRNPGLRYPIGPSVTKYGGMWFRLYDDLYDWGYDTRLVNGAIGSASFVTDIVGKILDRTNDSAANNMAIRSKRASIGNGDRGFFGDIAVIGGKLFVATSGKSAYCMQLSGAFPTGDTSFVPELDYTRVIGTGTTGTSPPDSSASTVGSTLTDGSVTWTCLSVTTTYLGYTYTAGAPLTESRVGFDPYGILRRVHEQMQAQRDARCKIIILQNAQSDLSCSSSMYTAYLNQAATYFLNRGYIVMIGLSYFYPSSTTTNYNNLTTGVNNSVAQLKMLAGSYYSASQVFTGANLYTILGSTGNMASGGAYFVKDSGQDNLHVNAPGAIAGGKAWADAIKAAVLSKLVP